MVASASTQDLLPDVFSGLFLGLLGFAIGLVSLFALLFSLPGEDRQMRSPDLIRPITEIFTILR